MGTVVVEATDGQARRRRPPRVRTVLSILRRESSVLGSTIVLTGEWSAKSRILSFATYSSAPSVGSLPHSSTCPPADSNPDQATPYTKVVASKQRQRSVKNLKLSIDWRDGS